MNKNKYLNFYFASRKSEATYVTNGNLYFTEWEQEDWKAVCYRFLP